MPNYSWHMQSVQGVAHQLVGGLATCLLVGSCLQEVVSEPEVGVLLYAGHVDVMSAKVG